MMPSDQDDEPQQQRRRRQQQQQLMRQLRQQQAALVELRSVDDGDGGNDDDGGLTCGWKGWFKKYFWEGQALEDGASADVALLKAFRSDEMTREDELPEETEAPEGEKTRCWLVPRQRQLVGMALPAAFFHLIWWTYMAAKSEFGLFTERMDGIPLWYMTITMLFGSMLAGSTSEGGGAVAFPVMTLVFGILPEVARDFSFMIQSVGMTSAAFAILYMRVKVETHALVYVSLGGMLGILFGLEKVAPSLTPAYSKMFFVSVWFSFAFSLFWLNRNHGRRVFDEIPDFESLTKFGISWRALVLLATGFIGGIFSSISGSGIDICCFSILTLLFRVSEKTATPTSVILMAINTCFGFVYRNFWMGGVQKDAWGYFAVCVPVVVLGAPFGSCVGSHFHRLVLASLVYIVDTAQLIIAVLVVKPWLNREHGGGTDTPVQLTVMSILILFGGAVFFKLVEVAGRRLLAIQEDKIARREQRESAVRKGVNAWLQIPAFDPVTREDV